MNPGDINPSENFDAIVVGTGISGGWAAKKLCEKGPQTLVLERGRSLTWVRQSYRWSDLDFEANKKEGIGVDSPVRKRNPRTSAVKRRNQVHDVPNIYMTDGAFMTSASCVNPSLTFMAFTARAADHAARQFKNGVFS
jgi:choline dehydrogenase-like flavoprotein